MACLDITLKWLSGESITIPADVIIWYDKPRSLVTKDKRFLLEWYEDKGDKEIWYLIEGTNSILEHLNNKKSLKELLLEGKTWLVEYSYVDDTFHIKKLLTIKELTDNFILPSEDSYIKLLI